MRRIVAFWCLVSSLNCGSSEVAVDAEAAQDKGARVEIAAASERSPRSAPSATDKQLEDTELCPRNVCCRCPPDPDPDPGPPPPPPPPRSVIVDVGSEHSHSILGQRGDDYVAFVIPPGTTLVNVVFDGHDSIGDRATLTDKPPYGAGPGSYELRVHWWFNAFYRAHYTVRVIVDGTVPNQMSGYWHHDTTGASPYDFMTYWPYRSDIYYRTTF